MPPAKEKEHKRYVMSAVIPPHSSHVERTELWMEFHQTVAKEHSLHGQYYIDFNPKTPTIEGFTQMVDPIIDETRVEFGINITSSYERAKFIGKKRFVFRLRLYLQSSVEEDDFLVGSLQPFFVFYELNDGQNKNPIYNRIKRSTQKAKSVSSDMIRSSGNSRRFKKNSRGKRMCRLRKLYVSFDELGWGDWVIAPPNGFMAYQCGGVCRFPLASHLNATNHAVLQSITHSVVGKVNSACCVPYRLRPLTMILYNKISEMTHIFNNADMIATACACM